MPPLYYWFYFCSYYASNETFMLQAIANYFSLKLFEIQAVFFRIGTQVPFDDIAETRDKFVMINPDGKVNYQLYLQLNSICPVDAKMFPFDHQTCNLTFGSWTTDRVIAAIDSKNN